MCHSPRHEFYRRHWSELLPVWMAVLGLTAWLAAEHLPPGLFLRGVDFARGRRRLFCPGAFECPAIGTKRRRWECCSRWELRWWRGER